MKEEEYHKIAKSGENESTIFDFVLFWEEYINH